MLGIYALPTGDNVVKFDDARRTLGPISTSGEVKSAEGFFQGVANTPTAIFAVSRGDEAGGWLSRAFLLDTTGKAADLKPLVNTSAVTHVGGPMALAVSNAELVVGEAGAFDTPHDSAISFYSPRDKGRLLLSVPTGLNDIVGLAYSPRSGLLYVLDLAWGDSKEAGLYRIDSARKGGQPSAKAVKIAARERPTALAFASDGTLYVTLLARPRKGRRRSPGSSSRLRAISNGRRQLSRKHALSRCHWLCQCSSVFEINGSSHWHSQWHAG